jgi:hypothetical protein
MLLLTDFFGSGSETFISVPDRIPNRPKVLDPKRAGSGSGAISGFVIQDLKIRIRIKMSRIRSTATYTQFGAEIRRQIRIHETIVVKTDAQIREN